MKALLHGGSGRGRVGGEKGGASHAEGVAITPKHEARVIEIEHGDGGIGELVRVRRGVGLQLLGTEGEMDGHAVP